MSAFWRSNLAQVLIPGSHRYSFERACEPVLYVKSREVPVATRTIVHVLGVQNELKPMRFRTNFTNDEERRAYHRRYLKEKRSLDRSYGR